MNLVERHAEDRRKAVDEAMGTIVTQLEQWDWASRPAGWRQEIRQALESLWEDGATIGYHEG